MLHTHDQNRGNIEWKLKSKYLLNYISSYVGFQTQINDRVYPEYRQTLDFTFENANQIRVEKIFSTLTMIQQPLVITELKINNPMILVMSDKLFSQNQYLTIESISIEQTESTIVTELAKKTASLIDKFSNKFHTNKLKIESLETDLAQFLWEVLVFKKNKFTQLYLNGHLLTQEQLRNLTEIQFALPRHFHLFETTLLPKTCFQVLDLIEDDHKLNLKLHQHQVGWEGICNQVMSKMREKSFQNLHLVFTGIEKYRPMLDTFQIIQLMAGNLFDNFEQKKQAFHSLTLSHMHFKNLDFNFNDFIQLLKYVNYRPHKKEPLIISHEVNHKNECQNFSVLMNQLVKEGFIINVRFHEINQLDLDSLATRGQLPSQIEEEKIGHQTTQNKFSKKHDNQKYPLWNQIENQDPLNSILDRKMAHMRKHMEDKKAKIINKTCIEMKFSHNFSVNNFSVNNFTQISHLKVYEIDKYLPYLKFFSKLRCLKYRKSCKLELLVDALKSLNLLNIESLTVNYDLDENYENPADNIIPDEIDNQKQFWKDYTKGPKTPFNILHEEFLSLLVKAKNLKKIQFVKRPTHTFQQELQILTDYFIKLVKIELILKYPKLQDEIEKLTNPFAGNIVPHRHSRHNRRNNANANNNNPQLDYLLNQQKELSKIDLKEVQSILDRHVENQVDSNYNIFRKIKLKFTLPKPLILTEYLESIGEIKNKYLIDIPFENSNYKDIIDYFKIIGMMGN
eukprot:403344294